MSPKRKANRKSSLSGGRLAIVITLVAILLLCGGGALLLVLSNLPNRGALELRVAYSPEKEQTFVDLVNAFNATRPRLSNRRLLQVVPVRLTPKEMIVQAGDNTFCAVTPDSSIWLDAMDRRWQESQGSEATLVGEVSRYMVSPVVIAMWRDTAEALGYPDQSLGWGDLLRAAQENPEFKWSHPSTDTASGLLATLAEFYAATGRTRDLTEELAQAEDTLAYVVALEKTVRHYGEGEAAVMERVQAQGRDYLDAFVVQEQLVVAYNRSQGENLVAIYPVEGTLWEDHPLALLEHPQRTDVEREAFRLLRDYLLSEDVQQQILEAGYRPGDLTIPVDGPGSPLNASNGVDPAQPYTTLQVPSPGVVTVVRNVWLYSKRHTNVYLVVDVSGSMRGNKLDDAKVALHAFLDQTEGDLERVGLITFSSGVEEVVPLTQLGEGRQRLHDEIDRLEPYGNTALLDGISVALTKLEDLNDAERINAIVVMTDGIENASSVSQRGLTSRLELAAQSQVPVLTFCIAYGSDADYETLNSIAQAGGGFAERGDLETIKKLYEALSSYF